jgi:hypothetical protein
MAGSPFLGMQLTGSPTMILYNNPPSSITLGSTFGTAETIAVGDQPVNRVVYFVGNNIYSSTGSAGSFYAAVGNNIYRTLDGGNNWEVATVIPSIVATNNAKSGLNIVTGADGLQYMCLMYSGPGNLIRGIRTTDGYTWISDGPGGSSSNAGFIQDTILGDTLYCISTGNGGIVSYQVSSGYLSTIPAISGDEVLSQAAMCVWNNNIYIAGYNTTSGARPLYIISGGSLRQVTNIVTSGTTATTTYKQGIFVDNDKLYVFFLQVAASTGWACYQIDTPGTYNVTNLTATVISGSMAGAGPGTSSRVLTYVEPDATGTNPTKYLLYAANGTNGTSFELFQWNGPNAAMTSIASGGNVAHAITVSKRSASNGVYSPFGTYPYIISSGPTTSGTVGWRVNFTLWQGSFSPTNNPNVKIRLWFGGPDDEYLEQVGTLTNPAVSLVPGTPGPVAPNSVLGPNNTSITGLTADGGITLYSITWIPSITITEAANSRFNCILEPFF